MVVLTLITLWLQAMLGCRMTLFFYTNHLNKISTLTYFSTKLIFTFFKIFFKFDVLFQRYNYFFFFLLFFFYYFFLYFFRFSFNELSSISLARNKLPFKLISVQFYLIFLILILIVKLIFLLLIIVVFFNFLILLIIILIFFLILMMVLPKLFG